VRPFIFVVHIYSQQYFEVLAMIMVIEKVAEELSHLLHKRGVQKGSDDRDPDYIPEQQEV
jgi:cytochrome b subunit of formate dehydrogenase